MTYNIETARPILARTPDTISTLTRGLSEQWTHPNEGPDTWSVFDIVGHLIHGEKTDWIPRAKNILEGGTVPFEPFDRFAQFEASQGKTLGELLDEFSHRREHNLNALDTLEINDDTLTWTGTHPEFGTVTLQQLLSTWVVHDLGHIAQIARVMAKQYKAEVGPWEAYIPILHR